MSKFRDRSFVIRLLIALGYLGNVLLAILLTIANVIVDPSVIYTFSFWFEFFTTLLLGYSTMALLLVLGMENTKDSNSEYDLVMGGIVRLNKSIVENGKTNQLKDVVAHDNTIRKLKAYLVKCDRKRLKSEFWALEYQYTLEYIKAYENANISELERLQELGYNLDSKKVRYKKIKESSLLTGRVNSNDEEDLGINTFVYVVDKKAPFLIVTSLVTIILAVITWQLAFTPEGLTELLGKMLIILYNSFIGYILGVDVIESYIITQLNKVRIYLQRFSDNYIKESK